ncbi:hypothetical protein [Arthrobacter sp. A2-55]|uniref:hypothetical protein n=1 Tax=Arthrobacter sp. A2-55 TaxID=2897337 RepID=UPI0021CD6F41|nr:hypothetical protein [Arthrobacter sp. A2-55]MCU6481316.1 hypothetical protein [Arthrobacter sp. A2-55]
MSNKGSINILRFRDAQQVTIDTRVQITVKDDGEILIDLGGDFSVEQDATGGRLTIRPPEPAVILATTKELAPE